MQGASGNVTGEDSSLLLKAASLQGTAEGAELPTVLEPRELPCAEKLFHGPGVPVSSAVIVGFASRSASARGCQPHSGLAWCAGPAHDGHGFRAYTQSANNKRKASEVGNLANTPAAKQASHTMARAASMTGMQQVPTLAAICSVKRYT